jgi:SAM-dependent methyltransferase
MNFKDSLYQKYRSTHNFYLQGGDHNLLSITKGFRVNDFLYSNLLPKNKLSDILDIGCGDGNFVYYLQNRGYINVSGIDLSQEQISLGNKLGIPGLEIGNIADFLPNRKENYHCIIAKDVIEHLDRQEAFDSFKLIYEALKEDGTFIMQVPNGEGLFYTSIFYGDYTHEMAYTFKSARQVLLNSGFNFVKAYPVNPFPNSFFGFFRGIIWRWKVLTIKFWKMIETGNYNGIFTSNIIIVAVK